MYNEIAKSDIRFDETNFINALDLELRIELQGRKPLRSDVVRKIQQVYQLYRFDQLGFIVTHNLFYNEQFRCVCELNPLSFHHLRIKQHSINKERGPNTAHNCAALLKHSGHPFLHIVLDKEPELGEEITKLLIEINEQFHRPTKKQFMRSNDMFLTFEREHSADTTINNEPLIKEAYTRRLDYKNISYYYKRMD